MIYLQSIYINEMLMVASMTYGGAGRGIGTGRRDHDQTPSQRNVGRGDMKAHLKT